MSSPASQAGDETEIRALQTKKTQLKAAETDFFSIAALLARLDDGSGTISTGGLEELERQIKALKGTDTTGLNTVHRFLHYELNWEEEEDGRSMLEYLRSHAIQPAQDHFTPSKINQMRELIGRSEVAVNYDHLPLIFHTVYTSYANSIKVHPRHVEDLEQTLPAILHQAFQYCTLFRSSVPTPADFMQEYETPPSAEDMEKMLKGLATVMQKMVRNLRQMQDAMREGIPDLPVLTTKSPAAEIEKILKSGHIDQNRMRQVYALVCRVAVDKITTELSRHGLDQLEQLADAIKEAFATDLSQPKEDLSSGTFGEDPSEDEAMEDPSDADAVEED